MVFVNNFVLIRTYTAGVHYGILQSKNGKEVVLTKSRRIWSWSGALSLNEIAVNGVDLANSRISVPADAVLLTECIEVLLISSSSNLPRG